MGHGFPAPTALAAAALCAMAWSSPRAQEVRVPAGELRAAVQEDLKPHASGSKTYNEIWTYQIQLDGNIQAYLNISRVNLGSFKEPVCGADLTLLGFKGRNYTVAREYAKTNFKFIDSLQQLQVHQNIWFSGKLPASHRLFFSTRKKEIAYHLDLEFSDITPGKVWGDGMFRLGSESVGIFIHIPRARVSGRLAINNDTLAVTGTAYMDHTFQTTMAPELVDAGYRYIASGGNLEVGYVMDPVSKYGNQPVGYGLREQGGTLTLLKPASLSAPGEAKAMGVRVATKLEIGYRDGSKTLVERKQDRLQQSVLHEFSGFTKMAIKKYMGGEILTFRGLGTLNGAQAAAYNFFIVD